MKPSDATDTLEAMEALKADMKQAADSLDAAFTSLQRARQHARKAAIAGFGIPDTIATLMDDIRDCWYGESYRSIRAINSDIKVAERSLAEEEDML